ncbi:hypothetical protein, partial [Yersinia intermedia]|uniref:hypothetical protein n=1 Tax=Yersinia intermedia TaxID=631 RepID=UPI00163F898B
RMVIVPSDTAAWVSAVTGSPSPALPMQNNWKSPLRPVCSGCSGENMEGLGLKSRDPGISRDLSFS